VPSVYFQNVLPFGQAFQHFLHPCGFFGRCQANMELYFLVKLGFYLSLDPELERTDFESFWQSVNFVDDDKDPVTPRVNELIYFIDLAALKVGDVNHIHND
jgi:hypothetical protein